MNNKINNGIGKRLRHIRETLGLKQKEFAEKLNISGATLSDVEKGKYKPGHAVFYNIALAFKVNLYYLLYGEGDMFVDPKKFTGGDQKTEEEITKEEKKFLWYFNNSIILRYRILSNFEALLLHEKENLKKEFENTEIPKF